MNLPMEKKSEQIHPDQWLKDLPAEAEIQGFDPKAMIDCPKCGRKSPPTRLKCLYCGTELIVSAAQAEHLKPGLRKLEDWEKGFNLIVEPGGRSENSLRLGEMAELLHLETDDLQKILNADLPLPVARAETNIEAEVLAKKLAELGARSRIISDQQLGADKLPKRLRGIEFEADKLYLILFNADEVVELAAENIMLIVIGASFERRLEATESMKKKDDRKVLGMAELSTDETLIDLYPADDPVGYRIESKGFDFSCLGDEKSLFAKENTPKLAEKLRRFAPQAVFNNEYLRIREELSKVWAVSSRNESGGLQRSLGKLSRTNITTVSNLLQFTKYSRLQNFL
jgi:hypothetical protein